MESENMAEVSELRMNVAALRRVDPYVKEILGTATHVALYSFNAEANEWERTDVEGALFVYSRNGEPYHGILIMNRLNTHNLVEPVVQGLEMQLQEPFLLYRNTRCRIFGIWFYDKDQCTSIASMLDQLVRDLDIQKKMPDKNSMRIKSVPTGVSGVDIFSMLSKAKEDFNSNKVTEKVKPEVEKKNIQENVPSKIVMDFFAKATSSVSHFKVHNGPHPPGISLGHAPRPALVHEVSENHLKPLLQRLMSNPAHSVEHIEKQQRSATPRAENGNSEGKDIKREVKVLNGNGFKVGPPVLPGKPCGDSVCIPKASEDHPIGYLEQSSNKSTVENSMNFLRISSPISNPPPPLATLFGPVVQPTASNGLASDIATDQRSSSAPAYNSETSKLALMPPTMFTSSVSKETNNLDVASGPIKSDLPVALMPVSGIGEDSDNKIKPEPLTKKQLLQAFNYLLKNDADFMNKLHEAYVKSFADIVHS